jgi:hypothetical protein
MRVALGWLLWSSWGYEFVLHFDLHLDRVLLAASFFISAWLVFIGFASRLACAWAALTVLVTSLYLGEARWTIWTDQHRQLTVVLAAAMALAPCEKSFSLDRWLALRRSDELSVSPPAERGPLWVLTLLRAFTSALFLVTTLSLLDADWLSGRVAARAMFGGIHAGTDVPLWAVSVAWAMLAAHAFVTIGLWLERTRRVALLVGVALYLLAYVAMPLLSTLPLSVCWLLFAFVPPEGVHRAIDRMHGRG